MKKQTRLYNIILPIWALILFPQILVFVIPGNLLVDCAVLFCTLLALRHSQKGAVVKKLWWKFWLLGFAADGVGIVWLFLGAFISPYVLGDLFYDTCDTCSTIPLDMFQPSCGRWPGWPSRVCASTSSTCGP